MGNFINSISNIAQKVSDYVIAYVDKISRLPELWREDMSAFFLVAGSLLVILLVLILLLVLATRRKRRRASQPTEIAMAKPIKPQRKFVPVVVACESEQDTVFLPLSGRILECKDRLTPDLIARIKKKGPRVLADIVSVYDRATPAVKVDLARLVRDQKMMEAYSRKLDDANFTQGTLIDAWACFPDEAVLRGFVELLASRDEHTQMAAVNLLCTMKEPKCLPMLMLALVQPDRYLPARVAEVFLSMPEQSAALLTYMLPEIDDKHKESVLEIIAQTGTSFEPENVLQCLRHKNYRVRAAAALALGAGRITEAMPNLMLAAADKRWQVRAVTARALGMIGDQRALAVLESLSHDTEGWVASSAQEALRQMDGVGK